MPVVHKSYNLNDYSRVDLDFSLTLSDILKIGNYCLNDIVLFIDDKTHKDLINEVIKIIDNYLDDFTLVIQKEIKQVSNNAWMMARSLSDGYDFEVDENRTRDIRALDSAAWLSGLLLVPSNYHISYLERVIYNSIYFKSDNREVKYYEYMVIINSFLSSFCFEANELNNLPKSESDWFYLLHLLADEFEERGDNKLFVCYDKLWYVNLPLAQNGKFIPFKGYVNINDMIDNIIYGNTYFEKFIRDYILRLIFSKKIYIDSYVI